ncbi:hypothetical protein [Shewanella sp. 10N.286.52.A9]|uniref:hypothetical protein n=1 Tax=Shewanella sp. 10N.286.52.A9 TaxID=3229711 RepID=UPI003552DF0A
MGKRIKKDILGTQYPFNVDWSEWAVFCGSRRVAHIITMIGIGLNKISCESKPTCPSIVTHINNASIKLMRLCIEASNVHLGDILSTN